MKIIILLIAFFASQIICINAQKPFNNIEISGGLSNVRFITFNKFNNLEDHAFKMNPQKDFAIAINAFQNKKINLLVGLKFENYKFYHAVDNIIFGTNIENNTVTNVNQDISVKNIGIGLTLQKNNAKKRFFTPVLCISYVRVLPIFTNVYISENSDPILYTGFDKIKENNFNVATGLKGYYSIGRKSALFMNISIAYSLSKDLLFWLNMHKLTSSINVGYRLNIKP